MKIRQKNDGRGVENLMNLIKIKKGLILCLLFILCIGKQPVHAASIEENSYSEKDLKLMSCAIYAEANGESYKGKLAVGNVIVNRMMSEAYPNTIKGVIYQVKQFSIVKNGALKKQLERYEQYHSKVEKDCIKAAQMALEQANNVVGKRLFFTKYTKTLAKKHPSGMKLGRHYFY